MGRSIYFTDLEIEKLIDYVSNSVELLGEAEDTWERTADIANVSMSAGMEI